MLESRIMRISIVDDDVRWIERIKAEILRYDINNDMLIDVYSSGHSYLDSKKSYDISFIDIEMPSMDGFETITKAREINGEGIYIILTTHTEMSRKGYCVNAFRYLDKACLEEMQEAIVAATRLLRRNEKIEVNVIGEGKRKIVLKDIICIETEKHYILIHTRLGIVKCSNSMKEIETMLQGKWFCRCHNAYIVNLDEIDHIQETILYLSNGKDIDISHRKMSQFKRAYIKRLYESSNA